MTAYYNEHDPFVAAWLRRLIAAGHLPDGDVDERSIREVEPADVKGYAQCHFFAGIGGWPLAARMAGWPDGRPLWTGSPPCQPFSVAGKQAGAADERHLWPELFRLMRAVRPVTLFGEQVAAAVAHGWLDGVQDDLVGEGYACWAAVIPACAVGAPHKRERLWFAANTNEFGPGEEWQQRGGQQRGAGGDPSVGAVGDANGAGPPVRIGQSGDSRAEQPAVVGASRRGFWDDGELVVCGDGKARRVAPRIRLLAHGLSCRVGRLRGFGNAIVPQVAAELIAAYCAAYPTKGD